MIIKPFVVENADKTNGMSSLLVSLFYIPTIIRSLLTKNVDSPKLIYLQEFIRINFIDKILNGKSVLNKEMGRLLDLYRLNGLVETPSIYNIYNFTIDKFNGPRIETNDGEHNCVDVTVKNNTTTKEIFNKWIKEMKTINNSPYIMTFRINRSSNNLNVGISKKIYYKADDTHSWGFHSVICEHKKNHYYAIIHHKNEFFIFDDHLVPSMKQINIDTISNKIKIDCCFIIYRCIY